MITRLRIFALLLTLMVLFIPSAHAQKNDPPSGQFGVGVYAISTSLPSGLQGTYALNQNVQVGTGLSLGITNTNGVSATTILVSPFFRYLFNSTVSPFVQGGLMILSKPTYTYTTVPSSNSVSTNVTNNTITGIFLGAGVAYYINHEIGVTAGVDFLNAFFGTGSTTTFGWGIVRVGADWFF